MKNAINLALLFLALNIAGCASIIYDSQQPIRISAVDKSNNVVTDVYCIMRNNNGETNLRTESIGYVFRSALNTQVRCSKNGLPDGLATLIPGARVPVFSAMTVGGELGAVVHKTNDPGFNYPDWIVVVMGDDLVYDSKDQKENQPLLGTKPLLEQN